MRYHMLPSGPALCEAEELCPLPRSARHYESPFAASAAQHATLVIPPLPPEEPLLEETVRKAFARTYDSFDGEGFYQNHTALAGSIVAYGLLGSEIYGLNHADSDRDIIAITDKRGRDVHKVFSDGTDIRIISYDSFVSHARSGLPFLVDLLQSDSLTMVDHSLTAFFAAQRFSVYGYMATLFDHTYSDMKRMLARRDNPGGVLRLKTAVRNVVMSERAWRMRLDLRVRFTQEEREAYFRTLARAEEALLPMREAEEGPGLLLEAAREEFGSLL